MEKIRRSGLKIMASLIVLLGSLFYVMILAVINGSLGFISAMSVTLFGAIGIAKLLGEQIALSYNVIITIIILSGVIRGVLRYFEQYSNHYIAFTLLAKLRDKIFAKLRVLCPAKLESKKKGSIISMITSDIETLEVFYAHTISPICIALIVSLVVIIFVGTVSTWYLSLVALIAYLTIGVVVPLFFSNSLKESGVSYRKEFANFNAYFLDSIKGIKDIVLNNAGEARTSVVNSKSEKLLVETKKQKYEMAKSVALTEFLVSFFILLTLVFGIVLVRYDVITIGRMIIGVVAIFGSFGPVIAISNLPGNLTQTFASGDRVLDLLDEKPVVEEVKGQKFSFDNLKVEDLNFKYDTVDVLKDVNLEVKSGEIIGIVGDSGCGKSTLLKLLLRFFKKDSGKILYNGIDIEEIDSTSLLENVTMVSQTTYLFDDTIEANLKIAKEDASKEEIIAACKSASCHDFIMNLKDGYKTSVGTLGDNLSAGEKQRIGLARAFLSGAKLILLDEPTSNVDSINEGIILKSLKDNKKDKTFILVSHRESTMSICDRIYKIKDGVISK